MGGFTTGIGREDEDGYFYIVTGRRHAHYKGYNVYPRDLERSWPSILRSSSAPWWETRCGGGGDPVSFVVLKARAQATARTLEYSQKMSPPIRKSDRLFQKPAPGERGREV